MLPRSVRVLRAEEEVELAKCIEAGLYAERILATVPQIADDRRAKLHLIVAEGGRAYRTMFEENISLIWVAAEHYPQLDEDTVIFEGSRALAYAIKRFDYTRGFKFSSYAVKTIRWRLWKTLERLHQLVGEPALVLYGNLSERPEVAVDGFEDNALDRVILEAALERLLTLRERYVVRLHLGLDPRGPMPLSDIAIEMKRSRTRVGQLWRMAIIKLGHDPTLKEVV
ncbi:MAG TPA: sigma-70 factor domain-containing protein [Candidatus Saccharimonadia bacterium]|nr:sigma-70 factor domain-containing protein [Candidatus Saccharimonadia bacterium]